MSTLGEGADEFEAAVRSTFSHLDRWRGSTGPFVPWSGSQLRADDRDWIPMPISQIAHSSLSVSVEHLQAVRVHVDQSPSKVNLFPLAQLTLCRTALVGAAQAVWVLAPPQPAARVRRGRTVAAEMQKRHVEYLRDLKKLGEHEGTDTVEAHVTRRIQELAALRSADGQSDKLVATDMIREAAQSTFETDELVNQVILTWRSGSGAAHGFSWPLMGRPSTVQTTAADKRGVAAFAAGGAFSDFAQPYMAAFYLCEHGWRLLRERGQ